MKSKYLIENVQLQQIRQKEMNQTLTKHQFSKCMRRHFIFLLDSLTRVDHYITIKTTIY